MDNDCADTINVAYQDGRINPYMVKKLLGASEGGMSGGLIEELIGDAQSASEAGVSNDEDYNIYFFVGRLADDILDDTFGMKVDTNRKKDLCQYVISHRGDGDYKFDNLTDYRLLIHKWLCDGISKHAYPNTNGKSDRDTVYHVDKWIKTLTIIYSSLHSGEPDKPAALVKFTEGWDTDEIQKFTTWMRYYEDGTTEKYNVKTAKFIKGAFEPEAPLPQAWVNREDRENDGMKMSTYKNNRSVTKREKELEHANVFKLKMRARLRSFKRLLERYHDILSKQDLDKVYDELYSLEKSVGRLDVYASIQDCIIRSANRLDSLGFDEGADFLHKCAVEPQGPNMMQPMPPPPPPPMPQPGANIPAIVGRLEGTSTALKSRDMIRELANIDILLHEAGMASYFPELSFAQSKLIEAFGYASNKVEDIIAKLRGSNPGAKKDAAPPGVAPPVVVPGMAPPPAMPSPVKPPPPMKPIDTGEILSKPVSKVKDNLPVE